MTPANRWCSKAFNAGLPKQQKHGIRSRRHHKTRKTEWKHTLARTKTDNSTPSPRESQNSGIQQSVASMVCLNTPCSRTAIRPARPAPAASHRRSAHIACQPLWAPRLPPVAAAPLASHTSQPPAANASAHTTQSILFFPIGLFFRSFFSFHSSPPSSAMAACRPSLSPGLVMAMQAAHAAAIAARASTMASACLPALPPARPASIPRSPAPGRHAQRAASTAAPRTAAEAHYGQTGNGEQAYRCRRRQCT